MPPLPGKPGVANPLWPNLEHFTRGNQSTIEAMERRHPDLLQTTEEQKIAREQQRYNASPMRGRGKGLSNDGADEAENLTTPSSQRVTPIPATRCSRSCGKTKSCGSGCSGRSRPCRSFEPLDSDEAIFGIPVLSPSTLAIASYGNPPPPRPKYGGNYSLTLCCVHCGKIKHLWLVDPVKSSEKEHSA